MQLIQFCTSLFNLSFSIFLFIAELPETKPHLWADRERYEAGDVLVSNCSTPPSRPRVELKLSINNIVVSKILLFPIEKKTIGE